MRFPFALSAALAASMFGAPLALADEVVSAPSAPSARPKSQVLVFGEDAARFHVVRDAAAGRMTFRLADTSVKVECAPVIVTTTDAGSREVAMTAVEGQPGTWVWADDQVRAARFDGTMRVMVAGKPYTSPLTTVWTGETVARHGGHVLALAACGGSVEVVQDPATGTLTIYSSEDVVVTEAPVITVTETTGPATVTVTKLEGSEGVWVAKHEHFKTRTTSARIRLLVNGTPCEAPLVYGVGRGGQTYVVEGGPSFEVVRDPKDGTYTFYAVEDTLDGKGYTVEHPTMVVSGRSYELTRVDGEPRAWRLAGLDTAGSDARDGQLNITLLGKTLSTRVGLSGVGLGVK